MPNKKKATSNRASLKKSQDVYLVIADNSEGFQLALRYAVKRVMRVGANLAILHVMDQEDFQHWGGVQERIHQEQREGAEALLDNAAKTVKDMGCTMPGIYLEEGGRLEVITEMINKDKHIRRLILGAEAHGSNPGELVAYFSGKGLSSLNVPLTIIPGHLNENAMDPLF